MSFRRSVFLWTSLSSSLQSLIGATKGKASVNSRRHTGVASNSEQIKTIEGGIAHIPCYTHVINHISLLFSLSHSLFHFLSLTHARTFFICNPTTALQFFFFSFHENIRALFNLSMMKQRLGAQQGAFKRHQGHRTIWLHIHSVLLLTVHEWSLDPEHGKVMPNLMCAAQREGVGASKCEVMIFPPSGAMPHTELTNREEKKRKSLFTFFISPTLNWL